jgi:uncharacterized protein
MSARSTGSRPYSRERPGSLLLLTLPALGKYRIKQPAVAPRSLLLQGDHVREARTKGIDLSQPTLGFLGNENCVRNAAQFMFYNTGDGWSGWDVEDGISGLHLAAFYGLADTASELLARGAKVDVPDSLQTTPLMYAASAGHSETARLLLRTGANPGLSCARGCTALHRACQNRHSAVVRALVECTQDVDVDARDARFYHCSARNWAVDSSRYDTSILELLLKRPDIDVNAVAPGLYGRPALYRACAHKLTEAVHLLLAFPTIKVNAVDAFGKTALARAASAGCEEVVNMLIDHGADFEHPDKRGGTTLLRAIDNDYLGCVRLLIKRGANCYFKDCSGRGILHGSAVNGQAEILRYLLSKVEGLDPNCQGDRGETPLAFAATTLYFDAASVSVAFLLTKRGASFDIHIQHLLPLLRRATEVGEFEVVKRLVGAGLPFQLKDRDGMSAYRRTMENGHTDIAAFLHEQAELLKTAIPVTIEEDVVPGAANGAPHESTGEAEIDAVNLTDQSPVHGDESVIPEASHSSAEEKEEDHVLVDKVDAPANRPFATKTGQLGRPQKDLMKSKLGATTRELSLVGIIAILLTLLLVR